MIKIEPLIPCHAGTFVIPVASQAGDFNKPFGQHRKSLQSTPAAVLRATLR